MSPTMDAILSPEQVAYRERLRGLVDQHILPRCGELDESTTVPWDILQMLSRESVLGVVIPQKYGGLGKRNDGRDLDAIPVCLSREQLMRGSCNVDTLFAMQGLGTYAIIAGGSEELKQTVLPPVAAGTKLAAYALTEPEGGSDVVGMETTAVKSGDGFVINGRKTFISNAGIAATYVVVAKTDPSKGAKGLSAFVVDGDTPGLSATEPFDMLAPHIIGAVTFKDCYVPASRLLGTVGEGFRLAMASLDIYRASVGAAAVGLGQAALEESVSRALGRKQFGQAIGEFQAIQFKIADMATQVEAARMMVYRAAKLRDMGLTPIAREASMAKLFATEVAARAVDEAVQIWGGLGVCKGVRVERLFRQARALRIYEGTSEIQRLIIGRNVLREARKAAGQ